MFAQPRSAPRPLQEAPSVPSNPFPRDTLPPPPPRRAPQAAELLGSALAEFGDPQEAIKVLKQAVLLAPDVRSPAFQPPAPPAHTHTPTSTHTRTHAPTPNHPGRL